MPANLRKKSSQSGRASEGGREKILNAAAKHFSRHGFDGASMRDIANDAGMRAGSLYYHFRSKEELLFSVETEAFARMTTLLDEAVSGVKDPWDRLTAACAAHLEGVLNHREYINVTSRELPDTRSRAMRKKFLRIREDYENLFRDLVEDLPLSKSVDRSVFRLTLLGAMAWTLVWYSKEGGDTTDEIARKMVSMLRHGTDGKA